MSEEVQIRVADVADAEALLKIYEPYIKHTAVTFEYDVPSVSEFRERISNILEKYPYLVAELDGNVVGYAYAASFHVRAACQWAVETSIYVKNDARGKGVGKALYTELEIALKKMGILNMSACIATPNEENEYLTNDSEKFHRLMGFVKVAEIHKCGYKFGHWYHLIWMEKMLGEHTASPMPVRRFEREWL